MGMRDDRVDAYIAKSAEFARPILGHLREVVHSTCPEAEEAIKWGFPNFLHRGLLCSMAAFKGHCAFGFWKGALLFEGAGAEESMGQFGRIIRLSDLPGDEVLVGSIRKAMALNEAGVKSPGRARSKIPKEVVVPDDLAAALAGRETARSAFEKFSPSHRREYIEWIAEAKTEATRSKRLATTLEWLAEGKPRSWKSTNC